MKLKIERLCQERRQVSREKDVIFILYAFVDRLALSV